MFLVRTDRSRSPLRRLRAVQIPRLRQELTYLHCHSSEQQLAERITAFVDRLLDEPATVHKRLRPKLSLNPQEEFLRV